jgi:hypothetical protein
VVLNSKNNKNKDQQGIGNVHRTPPPDTPKQDTQRPKLNSAGINDLEGPENKTTLK